VKGTDTTGQNGFLTYTRRFGDIQHQDHRSRYFIHDFVAHISIWEIVDIGQRTGFNDPFTQVCAGVLGDGDLCPLR